MILCQTHAYTAREVTAYETSEERSAVCYAKHHESSPDLCTENCPVLDSYEQQGSYLYAWHHTCKQNLNRPWPKWPQHFPWPCQTCHWKSVSSILAYFVITHYYGPANERWRTVISCKMDRYMHSSSPLNCLCLHLVHGTEVWKLQLPEQQQT